MRNTSLLAACLLAACTANQPLPRVDDGALAVWVYQCHEGRISAEYANMGGQYTATLTFTGDRGEKQRKVLSRDGDNHFTLGNLHWSSADGKTYALTQDGALLLSGCRSSGRVEDDGEAGTIRLQLNKMLQ